MAETLRDKLKSAYGIDIESFANCRNLLEGLTFFYVETYPNFGVDLHLFLRLLGGKKIVNWDQLKDFKKEDYKNIYALGIPDFELELEAKKRRNEPEVGVTYSEGLKEILDSMDSIDAKELGIEFIDEKEFIDLIIEKVKSYKPAVRKDWITPTLPEFGPYEYAPLGYSFMPEAKELFLRPATFYVVKIRVPMNDGSTRIVHKPGIAIDNVKGKVNSRYTSKAPLDVAIEIKNLNRIFAKELELRMQDILKQTPWYGRQYPEYAEASKNLHENWSEESYFLNHLVYKRKKDQAKERKRRVGILDESFFSRFTPVPDIPYSWISKYGLKEWRIFDGSDEELKEIVERTLKIVENYFENEGKERVENKDFFWGVL